MSHHLRRWHSLDDAPGVAEVLEVVIPGVIQRVHDYDHLFGQYLLDGVLELVDLGLADFDSFLAHLLYNFHVFDIELSCASAFLFVVDLEHPAVHVDVGRDQAGQCCLELYLVENILR